MNSLTKLANALAIQGFATVDLRTIDRTPFVPLSMAITAARTTYQTGSNPAWNLIADHLTTLKVMGVSTVAIRSDGHILRTVVLRYSPDRVFDIPEALSFLSALDQWADRFSRLLPDYKLSAGQQKVFEAAGSWAGRYTDLESVKWAASKLVYLFAKASGAGSCIVVNPVTSISADYLGSWLKADLQREHLITGRMHTASYLWNLTDGQVYAGEGGNIDMMYRPYPEQLQTLLQNALDY